MLGEYPTPEDPEEHVAKLLRRQMARLKRWFEWERWLLEPRSFAPPDDPALRDDDEDLSPH
jgi:hypothetical protein